MGFTMSASEVVNERPSAARGLSIRWPPPDRVMYGMVVIHGTWYRTTGSSEHQPGTVGLV